MNRDTELREIPHLLLAWIVWRWVKVSGWFRDSGGQAWWATSYTVMGSVILGLVIGNILDPAWYVTAFIFLGLAITWWVGAGLMVRVNRSLRRARVALASLTCPRCGVQSHNVHDIAFGYCGNCHDFTQVPNPDVLKGL